MSEERIAPANARQQRPKREKRDVHGWCILDKPVGMRAAKFTASPQTSYEKRVSPMTPAVAGPRKTARGAERLCAATGIVQSIDDMSPDLRLATVYVMPLGGRDTEIVMAALERNKKYLRGEVARRVNLKFAPDVRFRVDDRFDEAERIEKLLRTPAVQRDLAPDSDEDR